MKKNESKSDTYNTILTICIGFLIVYSFTKIKWQLNFIILLGLVSILSKKFAEHISTIWLKIGKILSFIIPNILLSIIFFVFLTPIAWLSRIFMKNDPLSLKNRDKSTFTSLDRTYDHEYFENPW